MSERLPYEVQLAHQWDAIPLPDINTAWADMKRRLDDEDDRKPIAWWSRGCVLWAFLLLALLGTGWWVFRPDKWLNKEKSSTGTSINPEVNKKEAVVTGSPDTVRLSQDKSELPIPEQPAIDKNTVDSIEQGLINRKNQPVNEKKMTKEPSSKTKPVKNLNQLSTGTIKSNSKTDIPPPATPAKDELEVKDDKKDNDEKAEQVATLDAVATKKDPAIITDKSGKNPDTLAATAKKDELKTINEPTDTSTAKANEKKDSSQKKPLFFSAGIAIHQQLPVAGQKLNPYNSLGRKASLADYIPSVYVRLNKQDKWFLQAEFRYGAPQYTKDFIYDQQSFPDTGQAPVFTTIVSLNLKKTFYHQLPLTFNYFVQKNWSLGAGLQWNKFTGAVAEQEINRRNNLLQQDSIIGKFILTQGDTAFQFTKSYFLGVVETEYKWKRFSAGARYSFGLQPYIRFSLPSGGTQQQRSTTLQVFLRYQLWRSKGR